MAVVALEIMYPCGPQGSSLFHYTNVGDSLLLDVSPSLSPGYTVASLASLHIPGQC